LKGKKEKEREQVVTALMPCKMKREDENNLVVFYSET
jgi:hypothetical protein